MTSEQDEAVFWAGKAVDAHHDMLDTVQAAAGKWQAAITAFLGVYATVGLVLGPTQLATLPGRLWLKIVIVAGYLVAGLIAIYAVWNANQAAQGVPVVFRDQPLTGLEMERSTRIAAFEGRKRLKEAIRGAQVAGGLVLSVSVCLAIISLCLAPPAPSATLVTRRGSYCGTIATVKGSLFIQLSGGVRLPVRGGTLTVVTAC